MTNKGQVLQRLCFKPAPNQRNMIMRACMFARDNSIYTLSTFPRLPTYLIRWEPTNPQAPKNWKA